jgi:signal transduction histidine kinase
VTTATNISCSLSDVSTGAPIVDQEITATKRAEKERAAMSRTRERLLIEAVEASRARDAFIATLSHELRTPLQSIAGWARLLRRSVTDGETSERAAAAIERGVRVMQQLLDDTIDISRVAYGKLQLHESEFDVARLVTEVVETVRPRSVERGISLVEMIPATPVVVRGDRARLRQVMWNLLSNALKFTAAGHVRVFTRLESRWVQISVADTGAGIPPDLLASIFDPFRQCSTPVRGDSSGLGLGLAIAKEIVTRHGGTIRAESAGDGLGATFTVRLPLLAPAAATPQAEF